MRSSALWETFDAAWFPRVVALTPWLPPGILRYKFMRVIAGEFGGRRLQAPRGRNTRPTSDRVREALFMSLGDLSDLSVVDLFAGSGAMGIEALSRGAREVHFVDSDRMARTVLEENLGALGIRSRTKTWPLTLPQGLKRLAGILASADLILADPPYGGAQARSVLEGLGCPGVLRPGTRVVLERHQKDVVEDCAGMLTRVRERRYGETVVDLFEAGDRTLPPQETSQI
ncbi:MAG: 16S rRNA (guanine(966)-N(2))-methyltransferase RsmD [Candidatus Eisenbacteria bacterium]